MCWTYRQYSRTILFLGGGDSGNYNTKPDINYGQNDIKMRQSCWPAPPLPPSWIIRLSARCYAVSTLCDFPDCAAQMHNQTSCNPHPPSRKICNFWTCLTPQKPRFYMNIIYIFYQNRGAPELCPMKALTTHSEREHTNGAHIHSQWAHLKCLSTQGYIVPRPIVPVMISPTSRCKYIPEHAGIGLFQKQQCEPIMP